MVCVNNQEERATSRVVESTTPEQLAAIEATTPAYTGEGKEEEPQSDLDDGGAGMEKAAAPGGGAIVVDDEGLDKVGPWLVLAVKASTVLVVTVGTRQDMIFHDIIL